MGLNGFILILGPCVIESEDHVCRMAQRLKRAVLTHGGDFVFKASFDKANRLSGSSFRGPGISEGLRILSVVKDEVGVRVVSDVHEPWQAGVAAGVLDVVQVPALLSRQTDLLWAAGQTGKIVNIKKGQFMAPEDMFFAAEKAQSAGAGAVWLTERGTTFGYRDLVVDMRSIEKMKRLGYPVIFDATHSVQKPGGGVGRSTGDRSMISVLALAAVAAGADGLFLEVHDDPDRAKSDGANSLRLEDLGPLLEKVSKVREAVR